MFLRFGGSEGSEPPPPPPSLLGMVFQRCLDFPDHRIPNIQELDVVAADPHVQRSVPRRGPRRGGRWSVRYGEGYPRHHLFPPLHPARADGGVCLKSEGDKSQASSFNPEPDSGSKMMQEKPASRRGREFEPNSCAITATT